MQTTSDGKADGDSDKSLATEKQTTQVMNDKVVDTPAFSAIVFICPTIRLHCGDWECENISGSKVLQSHNIDIDLIREYTMND